jgi:hypothetical protein
MAANDTGAANTVAALSGLFKTVYAGKLEDLVPDFAILQKKIDFIEAEKETGAFYAQPVNLAQESGFTYNGEAGTVVALNEAVAGQTAEAQVKGSELILRSYLSYNALSRASKQGTKAFKKASAWKVEDMNNSMRKRLEIAMLYGRVGIGRCTVSSNTLTISDATWAPGIWAGTEGQILEFYDGITGTDTKRTLNAGGGKITAVDLDAKTVTITDATNVTNNDYIFFTGSRTATAWNEMAGLQKIITNTGSLFNISAASYSMWKGNSVSTSGEPTHAIVQDAVSRAVNKGLMSKVICLISPKGWSRLNSDAASLRVFDGSYSSKKSENGSESLVFHSTNGQIEVVSHPFVKEGEMFLVPLDTCMRMGSSDVTFGLPGMDQEMFQYVPGYNACELQCFTDQAIFLEKPAQSVYVSGLTYS